MAKISFIMPAWKARFLQEAVASIVAQTCPDWELVVVDDCSPEPLREIVENFDNAKDQEFYAVVTPEYLHRKVVFEYFHLVLQYLPFRKLPEYLPYCRLASAKDKAMMVLRWFKHRLFREK